jgi:hypothetical protein
MLQQKNCTANWHICSKDVDMIKKARSNLKQILGVVDPNPKESESFGWIRIRIQKNSSGSDTDPDTVVG